MNRLQQYFLSVLSFPSTALICAGVLASDVDPPVEFKTNIPEIGESKQMILVTTDGWNVVPARLSCFERAGAKSEWRQVFPPSDAVVGENGLAWGIGLHGTHPTDGPVKQEGDGRAPTGVFFLHEAFGYAAAGDAKITSFPYTPITPTTEGVDDVNSRYYNRVIDSATISDKDWRSSEIMLRQDGLYRWGVVVEHNWKPFPGFGSCIFLHIWRGANQGTAGCTAMPADTIEKIIRWADETKRPVFVQLPKEIYIRVKDQWSLP
jgi:zinc D-Ala-D-Ala dipeptidase